MRGVNRIFGEASGVPEGRGRKAFDATDYELAERMRASRASRPSIARALGTTEPDARRRFDPSYPKPKRG